jgi:hypothetical protein
MLYGVTLRARRVRQLLTGSPRAQVAAGGVVAVLVAGVAVGIGALHGDGSAPALASTAGETRDARTGPQSARRPPAPVTEQPAAPAQRIGEAPPPTAEPAPGELAGGAVAPVEVTRPAAPTAPVAPTTKKPATKPVTYDAIAGLGCTGKGTSYRNYGWFKNGSAGWYTLGQGSTHEGGCDGRFDDMPMSGDPHRDTPSQAMVYGFQIGPAEQLCDLYVFVPTSPSQRDVIAVPAHLAVITGTTIDAPLYGSPGPDKYLNQRDHHSTWLSLGRFPVGNGAIGIKVTNRGYADGYDVTYPHVAGGAARARCTAA